MSGRRAGATFTSLCSRHLGVLKAITVDCEPWASATFAGQRLLIGFTTEHPDPAPLLRDLPEADIATSNSFVADLQMVSCAREPGGWRVALEALVIDLADA